MYPSNNSELVVSFRWLCRDTMAHKEAPTRHPQLVSTLYDCAIHAQLHNTHTSLLSQLDYCYYEYPSTNIL